MNETDEKAKSAHAQFNLGHFPTWDGIRSRTVRPLVYIHTGGVGGINFGTVRMNDTVKVFEKNVMFELQTVVHKSFRYVFLSGQCAATAPGHRSQALLVHHL